MGIVSESFIEGLQPDGGNIIYEGDKEESDMEDFMLKDNKFIMKNGCCRECMKAFSKSGKVSIIN